MVVPAGLKTLLGPWVSREICGGYSVWKKVLTTSYTNRMLRNFIMKLPFKMYYLLLLPFFHWLKMAYQIDLIYNNMLPEEVQQFPRKDRKLNVAFCCPCSGFWLLKFEAQFYHLTIRLIFRVLFNLALAPFSHMSDSNDKKRLWWGWNENIGFKIGTATQ